MAQTTNLAIYKLRYPLNDKVRYEATSVTFSHVASCVRIAMAMLQTEYGCRAMIHLALHFDQNLPSPWYGGLGNTMFSARQFVLHFVSLVNKTPPVFFIDEGLKDPENLACTYNQAWSDRYEVRSNVICLNAQVSSR